MRTRPTTIDGVGITYDALGRMVEQSYNKGQRTARMRVRIILAAVFFPLGMLVVSASAPDITSGQEAPKVHIDKGACPYECCTYREWVARTDFTLVDRPDGKRVVGRIKKGEKVLALTGEVHSVPVRAVAQRDYSDAGVKVGETIYILPLGVKKLEWIEMAQLGVSSILFKLPFLKLP